MGDIKLPWQYTLLGFLGFGAIFAVMLLVFTFPPNDIGSYYDPKVRYITIAYLLVCIGLTPVLLRSGRPAVKTLNPAPATPRRVPRASPMKRLAIFTTMLLIGIGVSALSYQSAVNRGRGVYFVCTGMMAISLIGMARVMMMKSTDDSHIQSGPGSDLGSQPIAPLPTPPPMRQTSPRN
jgi:hypothetical protein